MAHGERARRNGHRTRELAGKTGDGWMMANSFSKKRCRRWTRHVGREELRPVPQVDDLKEFEVEY
jgi:hypothetical protein